jgi:D-alanyl-D-alanine carboxypeptidase
VTDARGNKRLVVWTNTNKLLEKGFSGIKTGITPNAGPCLSSMLKNEDASVIVTLLNCKSIEHRFTEAEKLAQWALFNIGSVKSKLDSMSNSLSPKKLNTRIIAGICKQV